MEQKELKMQEKIIFNFIKNKDQQQQKQQQQQQEQEREGEREHKQEQEREQERRQNESKEVRERKSMETHQSISSKDEKKDEKEESLEMVKGHENGVLGPREKLKRHRREVAGQVWIPDMWGQEDFLKDWIDCTAFDASLKTQNLKLARTSLMEEGRRSTSYTLSVKNTSSVLL